MRRFEILLEKLNRKDLQDLKEEPRSILSSRSLRSSWFIISVLTATSSWSEGTAELFRVSPPEAVVYLNGITQTQIPTKFVIIREIRGVLGFARLTMCAQLHMTQRIRALKVVDIYVRAKLIGFRRLCPAPLPARLRSGRMQVRIAAITVSDGPLLAR